MTPNRYARFAIVLHWAIAALILVNIPLGIIAGNALDTGVPADLKRAGAILGLHKPIGLTVLVLSLVWAAWRAAHASPPLPDTTPPWQKRAARVSHAALYILLIAVPLSGWIYVSTSPWPTRFFGLFVWPALPVVRSPAGDPTAGWVHDTLGWAMTAVAAIHILAALHHQFVQRDRLLGRMWSAGTDRP